MIICDCLNKFILHDIDLHIPRGISLGIIGTSGSGKTTFLKLASGLLLPESGTIYTLRKNPLEGQKKVADKIAVLYADIPLYDERLSIMDGLDQIRIIYGIKKDDFQERLNHVMSVLDFADIIHSKPKSLSLGQKRRAELGMTFIRDADLYIFDEPCIGLDQNAKAGFYKLVQEKKQEGKTLLVSSHSMEDIRTIADRVLLFDRGRVAFYGSKEELYKRLSPIQTGYVEFEGKIPDVSDLEIESYSVENGRMTFSYNSNHVSSKEVLKRISLTSNVSSVALHKASLAESIRQIYKQNGMEVEN
ncbi:MAG: ABC transporter ATP-binding protein [Treponema sp.]|nr:ABC transporter ATP-binding protein [Treponema sp.]